MHTDIDMEDIKLEDKTKIIAVAGKGGVGKTSLAGVIVKLLVESFPDKKILAIDADPAVGLSTVLNVDVDKTIDDIRKEVIKNVEDGDTKSAVELLGEAKYEIYDALKEQDDRLTFIVEDSGSGFTKEALLHGGRREWLHQPDFMM